MAERYDIKIVRGESFSRIIETDLVQGGDFDLSDYTVEGGVKFRYTEPDLVAFSVYIASPPTEGLITISLNANETRGLPVTQCVYYLKAIHNGDGTVIDLLNGYANVYPL